MPVIAWSEPDEVFATDACLTGAGGVIHGDVRAFYHAEFPTSVTKLQLHIHQLELLAIVVGVKLWAQSLVGQKVLIQCDNEPSVFALNSGRTRDGSGFVGRCLRELWLICSLSQIELRAIHIAGVNNRQPDWLSRWHLDSHFGELFYESISGFYIEEVIFNAYFDLNDKF